MHQNQIHSSSEQLSSKNSNPIQIELQRKKRRKRIDQDGRDYTCVCGKSYLSYPALYTHVKTKHNEQSSISQKLKIPQEISVAQNRLKQPQNQGKPQRLVKEDVQEDMLGIQKLKQFLQRQFIKDRSKQVLMELSKSLKLREDQIKYISQILNLIGNIQTRFEETENKNFNSSSKSENSVPQNKEDPIDMMHSLQNSPEFKKYEKSNLIRSILEKNKKQKKPSHTEKRGFTPCLFPIQQVSRKTIKREDLVVDEILGMFLNDFFKMGATNDMTSQVMTYFLCQVKEFFNQKFRNDSTLYKTADSLIQESSSLVSFLINMENPYVRQPVVVCKVLFFLYRWMFKHQITSKFVKFNQAGP